MANATPTIDSLETLDKSIRDERKMYANTAYRIGDALLQLLYYLKDAPYLRKDQADSTSYLIKLLAGAVIGTSEQIKLNPDGSVVCGSIKVNGSAVFDELVFNQQNILEGDTYFTDRAIIDSVENSDLNQYTLIFRQDYEGEQITFHVNDILRSSVNNLDADRTYRTTYLRVNSVDAVNHKVVATLYGDQEVPGGKNYPPKAKSTAIRWGNSIDTDRQQVFFVSAVDGRFLFLQGVSTPIVSDDNYSCFVGIPANLDIFKKLPISNRQSYVYARGLIVQDIIRVDYKGNPNYTARDCGLYDRNKTYIHGYDNNVKGYFSDRVWYGGCLWQCSVAECVNSEPRFNNTNWTCLLGGQNFNIVLESSAGNFFRAGTSWTTILQASVYNAEMLLTEDEIGKENILWARKSTDVIGDVAWNKQHAQGSVGLALSISSDQDLPFDWSKGSQVAFTITLTMPDGSSIINSYTI